MGLINILNPISPITVTIEPPGGSASITITGTLKRPPHKKETSISFTFERSTDQAQARLFGLLTTPPDYYIPFVGPGFWPPGDPNTNRVESHVIPNPPWETTDIALSINLSSVNSEPVTLSLYDFKVEIKSHLDFLPILGVG